MSEPRQTADAPATGEVSDEALDLRSLVVRRVDVPLTGLPPELDGTVIAHVSDFHFRRWDRVVEETQRALLTLPYDLLLVTGDFSDWPFRWRFARSMVERFFEPVVDCAPSFAVLGNHDEPRLAEGALPIPFLRNESRSVCLRTGSVVVAGVEQSRRGGECLDGALSSEMGNTPTVLMAHYPSTVFRLGERHADLVLSGHTHGGQIRLPWLGCIWTNDRLPNRMSRGLHRVGERWLHVSAGLGASQPIPMRINCPPEFSLLTLRRVTAR